jgi:AraC family transcriptional regulator
VETLETSDHCPGGQRIRASRWPGVDCCEMLYQRETRLEKHAHSAPHFTLSMDGCYHESSGAESFHCGPRGVVYQAAGQPHTVTVGHHGLRSFLVELRAEVDAGASRKEGAGSLAMLLPATPSLHAEGGPLAEILGALYSELRSPDDCSRLAVEGLVLQLMATATRWSRQRASEPQPPWLELTVELLRDCFRSRMTLREIADTVGVPSARLSMAFRRVYHRTIGEEQRRLRIEFAAGRLGRKEISLAEIALEAGFSDQAHFCRAFKESTGTTPARYRAAMSA